MGFPVKTSSRKKSSLFFSRVSNRMSSMVLSWLLASERLASLGKNIPTDEISLPDWMWLFARDNVCTCAS